MDEEVQHSLECIQANQIFPRKQLIREEEDLQVPFPELHGESTEYVGRAEDAIIALSNYRLHIKFKESVVNVPLQLIESVECRDIFQLHLTCKDCKVIRCQFSTFEQCQEWLKRLNNIIHPPSRIEDLFSFAYHAWCMEVYASEKEQHGDLCRPGEHVTSRFKNEVERMGFDVHNAWRISHINDKYKLCASYPQQLIVPAWITDKELESVATFRSWKRIPAVVYRHQSNGAVIARCGQPEVSWWGWRNADDEHLVQSIAKAGAVDSNINSKLMNGNCPKDFISGVDLSDGEFDSSVTNASGVDSLAIQPRKLLILDARSYAAAVANRAKGGGCECPEYYPNCEVVFMGMANIHSIRKSFQALRLLCTQMPDPANWLSALESTKWLQHLSVLLKSALVVIHAVNRDHRPVLVHCSDGWDRTPQIVALAKLLLDPYYRTIEGFQVLVEMEWLDFGHKFADRCGHGENSDDLNERCPVFLQWLDCVHQLQRQFPCSFEFNEAFLVKLVQHTYSCLFGTFLCNNTKEREEKHTQERTCSVWSLLRPANKSFKNLLYSTNSETVLYPVCHVRNLLLWNAVYLPSSSPSTPVDETCAPYLVSCSASDDQHLGRLPKTRSFDNLTTTCDSSTPTTNRRSSDPSLNEKWQEHRRSLELGNLGNPSGLDGSGLEDPINGDITEFGKKGRTLGGAELSVAAGVAEGQMENILQEASKEENGLDESVKGSDSTDGRNWEQNITREDSGLGCELSNPGFSALGKECELSVDALLINPLPHLQLSFQNDHELKQLNDRAQVDSTNTVQVLVNTEPVPLIKHVDKNEVKNTECQDASVLPPSSESQHRVQQPNSPPVLFHSPQDEKASLMESSTETLTEDGAKQEVSSCINGPFSKNISNPTLPLSVEASVEEETAVEVPHLSAGESWTSDKTIQLMPSPACALVSDGHKDEIICNGEMTDEGLVMDRLSNFNICVQKYSTLNGHCSTGETGSRRAGLSRQVSLTSCGSVHFQPKNFYHRWLQGQQSKQQLTGSQDQAARSHLDDDGLAVHSDVVQQRLRQIEAGHQQEVETLKKQVQELRSRLESQLLNSSLCFSGDFADEVTSVHDCECNLDHNCLSRCSTEIFSDASWEHVDKQDTEVTRWLPDHLAAHCCGCDSKFWLASRKHHCRNCGNVFCSSCCNQRVPVPSQQLFEPSRVCKFCYNSLQPNSCSLELKLDKPIAASSN
ncbi:myotubularin-related protein 3 isoform X1 [Protopterus annectens]|uniref:myotubularin-related protein 3 isoform X1 n=1 Tax=Protopterus annectens TaxID=7888 RepID=UPI001CFBD1B1|nr:myotubularin-related protein 3 isoform X1 [Protopterus annectens]XP_043924303.1 myotubularin-related protein 3 isoform X1 [Protopterus annectens]XP_043924304.1 myotubularin-related protein 3 isoform X1 [Protopterus annectens]XP_043924305.1 myotubularin-related protein 3 isoform X1 [Protopterus annectens]XP_043924306.1 myotubularin-related protein 3 isoform X1 [Protopterus annectens]